MLRRRKRQLKNIILLLITFIFVLIIVEVTLSWINFPVYGNTEIDKYRKPHEILHHVFIPNSYGRYEQSEYSIDYYINSLGLRNEEIGEKNKIRILMLGDSMTEGVGVQVEDSIPKQVEKMLREKGKNVEVINAAVGSYSPILEWLYFKNYGIQLQPDLVVLNLDSLNDVKNDLDYENMAVRNEEGETIAVPGKKELVEKKKSIESISTKYNYNTGVLISRALNKIRVSFEEESETYEEGNIYKDPAYLSRFKVGKDYAIHTNRSLGYVKKVKELSVKEGIKFLLVTYPHAFHVNENEGRIWRKQKGLDEYPKYSLIFFDTVGNYAKQNNIDYVDTVYKFENTTEHKLFYEKDVHMTKEGYRLVAEAISEKIIGGSLIE